MYNQITITPTELVVSPAGLDRFWALKGAIRVPWRHVTGIFRDQGAFKGAQRFALARNRNSWFILRR